MRDVIIGFTVGTGDSPAQSGMAPDRQGAENITLCFAGVNRKRCRELAWVVGTRLGKKQGASEASAHGTEGRKATWDVEETAPFPASLRTLTTIVVTSVAKAAPRSSTSSGVSSVCFWGLTSREAPPAQLCLLHGERMCKGPCFSLYRRAHQSTQAAFTGMSMTRTGRRR